MHYLAKYALALKYFVLKYYISGAVLSPYKQKITESMRQQNTVTL